MKNIGEFIAAKRNSIGKTQEDLGKALGVCAETVDKWEKGEVCPDVSKMTALSLEFNISFAQLLNGNDDGEAEVVCEETAEGDCDIVIDREKDMGIVSPLLYGNNLEHTRSSVNKGLSAQMLKNRKFVGKPSVMEGVAKDWFMIGEKTFGTFSGSYTHHDREHYHMVRYVECNAQQLMCCDPEIEGGFGQHELDISSDEVYSFAIVAKCIEDVNITVSLTDRANTKTYASTVITIKAGDEWTRYEAELAPTESDRDADLRIVFKQQVCISVGAVSMMNKDNFRGMRKDAVEALKDIGVKVLRWPGGNFAGEYNWFDGLLPVDERAPLEAYQDLETQPHSHGYDFHEINTDDFVALCRYIGAEPFITINPTWNTPEENAAWVEYCNGDENTTYGKIRIERGYKEPYNVVLWSLGNEFGCGHMEGDNSPAGYARLARRNAQKMLEACPNLTFCSAGPHPNKEWVDFSAKPLKNIVQFVSFHTYTPNPSYSDLSKLKEHYYGAISGSKNTRRTLRTMRKYLGNDDISISFDEWNLWYAWYRKSTVTDGMHTALMMNMIIGEAPISNIGIACHFEMVNEGAIKVNPHDVELTATGKMLKLMSVHMGGRLLYSDDYITVTEKDGLTTVTAINSSCDNEKNISFNFGGKDVKAKAYVGKTLMPLSDFEEEELSVEFNSNSAKATLVPLSVALIQFEQ